MSKIKKILIIDEEKYYHDSNVVGLVVLFFFAGFITSPLLASVWLTVFGYFK